MAGNEYQERQDLGLREDVLTGEAGAERHDGLSWTWALDVEALVTAITDPAPWTCGPPNAPDRPAASAAPKAAKDSAANRVHPAAGMDSAADETPMTGPGATQAAAPPDAADAELAEYLDAVEAGRSQVVPLPVLAGRVAESIPAGPGLAGWLGTGPVAGLEDGALAGIAASYRRLASWAQAGELAAVAELASRSAAADDRIGVDEHGRPTKLPQEACAEVSLALTMSQAAASWWADLAVTLRWRLAATGAALAAGTIDLTRARAIADATAHLDDQTALTVQDRVLPKAGTQTTAQLRATLRRAVIAADPHGADRRREEAEKQAKVMLYPDAEGTASLGGYSLPGIPATAAMARITALARALQASGAGGGIDLLRAHVFLGLLLGTLPHIPPPEGAPPDEPPPEDSPGAGPPDDEPPGGEPRGGGQPDDEPPGGESPDGDPPGDDPSRARTARRRSAAECPGRDDRGSRRDHRAATPNELGNDHDEVCIRPPPAWPKVPAFLQPGPAAMNHLIPATGAAGLLDLSLPWDTLTGYSPQPGHLGQLGPITATQARQLAHLAATDPATRWRIILTGLGGRAIATTRVVAATRPGTSHQAGLIKQVTVTIGLDCLTTPPAAGDMSATMTRVLTTARSLADHAAGKAARDAQTGGGCAHANATPAYRPTTRLRDYVIARDLTCRFPTCRQPAWRCDLDHTTPFDQGGRTCSCNLGGLCRFHHQIKGQPRWRLHQPTPGSFTWTTPTGRRYTTQPDSHADQVQVMPFTEKLAGSVWLAVRSHHRTGSALPPSPMPGSAG